MFFNLNLEAGFNWVWILTAKLFMIVLVLPYVYLEMAIESQSAHYGTMEMVTFLANHMGTGRFRFVTHYDSKTGFSSKV